MTAVLGPLLPVVVIDDAADARPLGEALREGGIMQVEVTLRTPAAVDAIREMSSVEGLTVGAGTVLTAAHVDAVVDAGAQFLVSPGWDDGVAERAGTLSLPWVPGVATATEVMRALTAGIRRMKLFPVASLGGVAFIDALAAVFPDVTFVPSGGIAPQEVRDYLSRRSVDAVSGSWMAPRAAVAARDFDAVVAASRRAVKDVS